MASFSSVWGDLRELVQGIEKALYGQKMRASRAEKLGSKIVQVKGVMPPRGGITRETPTGRAAGEFAVWHNFFLIQGKCYAIS